MWVRVSVKHADAEPVLQDLLARQARIEEVHWGLPRSVIRARAPLRRLLAYPQALPGLSDSSADLRMWLSHYRAPPPGRRRGVAQARSQYGSGPTCSTRQSMRARTLAGRCRFGIREIGGGRPC
jgi:hypothetical protein